MFDMPNDKVGHSLEYLNISDQTANEELWKKTDQQPVLEWDYEKENGSDAC